MSKKNYSNWGQIKTIVNDKEARLFYHERDVWWCSVGLNIGDEQDGKGSTFARPVLVFKKFNNNVFWGIPITKKIKTGKFYVKIELSDGINRSAILSQLKLMDSKRLVSRLGIIIEKNYAEIQKAVIKLIVS